MALAFALGLLTTAANMIGSYLAIARTTPHVPLTNALIGVSGGFILGVALLEIVPEALDGGGALIPPIVVAGYLLMYLVEQYFAAHAHGPALVAVGVEGGDSEVGEHALHSEFQHAPRPITRQGAMAAFFGFLAHDFLDGLAIGAAILADSTLGLLVFLGVLLHEIPAGLSVATLMRSAGNSRAVSFFAGVAIGLITLPGILIPFLVGGVDDTITHVFLALAAGTFLYISTTILIPAAGVRHNRAVIFSVVAGALLFWAVSVTLRGILE